MAESAEKGMEKEGWTHLENGNRNRISPAEFVHAKLHLRLIAPHYDPACIARRRKQTAPGYLQSASCANV